MHSLSIMVVVSVVFSLLQFSWTVVLFTGCNALTKKKLSLLLAALLMHSNATTKNTKSLHGISLDLLPLLSGLVVSPPFFSTFWTWLVCSGEIFAIQLLENNFSISELNLTLKSVVWISKSMVNQHIQQQHMVTVGIPKAISICPVSIESKP